ncbi:Snf7-domain-containing protein [Pelagophyceae sp. CCMP2097]|nr:Snf7-domain-containing protein [Pelagophyceae sp. CCMP2097]|mmetsp:Transcript_6779/g.21884  ORF Transcript_6779/g.21884 Transcript_6779/m.21884 type:complete len:217 (+) Transcript_6779:83-733(+)
MSGLLISLGLRKAVDPQEEMKKWKREISKEMRSMDREIKKIEQMENKSKAECEKLGKAGRIDACKIIAKEIVRTRKTKERMFTAKAQMNSVSMQLQTQAAMVRAAGCMKKSAEVMTVMNKLVKLPELQKTMVNMSREMERAGLIEEMIGDSMDMLDGDSVEDETDLEVNKVVAELTGDMFKGETIVPSRAPAQPQREEAEADDDNLDIMKARLEAL